ncbi:putative membrane protein [[Clostridium] bifermentans ATCC 638]|uniref:Putative membrane protein n=1 Tax=Paraclostridium bifermentans ATCC 638 = DSM 14991 TaxID=1233171 RepID=T4VMZ6_PARBF|nr:hypothetical protein [Paraclostridium bifermentans]EQK42873.1 putative membrane protein [[Clostridium] bifermentans ATCC 638] [Paraclostridium bifermentans ATCC 638 = DSM 14991]RIZ58005.1 hypothetical protein CHH45_13230 [Paraclostridium bifermentans]UAG16759.1 hypothetical protein KXZ80_08125 [Paraclostridium bifermentans]
MGFIIWALLGILFIVEGIYCIKSKKEVPFGFWSNGKKPSIEVKNIKAYNKALGKLWCIYGFFLILLGIPLLGEQNSPLIIITLIGSILEVIILMYVYTIKIEGKYRKK